jgi:outer membrane protein OmpA-like peptidoglycan-associated protein
MNARRLKLISACALTAALCTACVTVPPGPPPDIVRLQSDLDRLHADPRIAGNAGEELNNADAAVATLSRNSRTLDARSYQQGVYIAGKLIDIAQASALARYAEQRGVQLGTERERLLARASAGNAPLVSQTSPAPLVRNRSGEAVIPERAELETMQGELGGLESRVDERGLVVRLGDYMFEPGQTDLTPTAARSLDSLARAMRVKPHTQASIAAYGADGDRNARAATVRDYLNARGVDLTRLDLRGPPRSGGPADSRVEIVIWPSYR